MYMRMFPCVHAYVCVCSCASMWNVHYSYVNIHRVLSSLPWLHSRLFIDRHSEFISHCDSFLPGRGGKRIIIQIKSSDSTEAHNAHCLLITGQNLRRMECCPEIFYMRVHECVLRQWHIVISLLIDTHNPWVRIFGKFLVHSQKNSEVQETGWRREIEVHSSEHTNKQVTLGGRPRPFGIQESECHVLRKLKDENNGLMSYIKKKTYNVIQAKECVSEVRQKQR